MTELVAIEAGPVERSRAQILEVVSARVADVGNEFARLDQLVSEEVKHQAEIARLADEKSQILENRDLDKQQRITKVGKILAAVEVENADLAKKKAEILRQREHIKEVGITGRGFISHVFDQLRASRLTRARAFIDEFFGHERSLGLLPVENLAAMSILCKEVDLLSYDLHPQSNLEAELTGLRGLTERWSVIRGLCEQEPGFSPALPESWL